MRPIDFFPKKENLGVLMRCRAKKRTAFGQSAFCVIRREKKTAAAVVYPVAEIETCKKKWSCGAQPLRDFFSLPFYIFFALISYVRNICA